MDRTTEPGLPEESEEPVSIALVFAAGNCPDCRRPGEPGPCVHCGSEVPPALEIGPEASARLAALGPVGDRIRELRSEFDDLPAGRIPLTPDQFVAVVIEADLFDVLRGILTLPGELQGLDLSDPKVVGRDVRRRVEIHLDRVSDLLTLCREIGEFQTEGPGAKYRDLAIESGKYGADVAGALVRALTAPSFVEAREAAATFENLIGRFPLTDALSDALAEIERWKAPDLNSRVALAIGRPGTFTDEDGNLDLAQVFAAFGDESEPFAALEERAASYFAHLTGNDLGGEGAGAVLVAPLVLVAAADRPLRAHRALRMLLQALEIAWSRDQAAVEVLVRRSTAQGPIIFAALERVERAIQDLNADIGDDRALDHIMHAYRNLAESAFRTVGWLAIGADLIADGKPLPDERRPPMLGEMQQQLEAGSSISRLLADSVDPNLRNADAHAQYRWDRDREVAKDLRTGQEWSTDDLQRAVQDLSSCLAGADAGYGCFVVTKSLDHGVPDWLAEGEAPEALKMLAMLCFGPYGHEVVSVQEGGGTIVIERSEDLDPARLLPSVAGLVPLAPSVDTFRVLTAEGEALVDIEAATMKKAIEAPPALKGIEVLVAAFENCLRLDMDAEKMAHDFAVLIVKVVAFSGLASLRNHELSQAAFREVGDRLAYTKDLLKTRIRSSDPELRILPSHLGRARAATVRAAQGDRGALKSLVSQLGRLTEWADAQGVIWPPREA